ncbi:NACHT domain-containing protein [Nonomuraea sp. NPDC050022]|uniref:NACHT and WD40 repeat domain-containing protein n=1 Tax=Nonomuraea sp. NPDC050022 TaxID=3364358 RepID=UPI0037BB2FE6
MGGRGTVSRITRATAGVALGLVGGMATDTVEVDAWWWKPFIWGLTGLIGLVVVRGALDVGEVAQVTPVEPALAMLRKLVKDQWSNEADRVLGLGLDPMPVRWNLRDEARFIAGPRIGGEITWSGSGDKIKGLADRFRASGRRLVVLGGPGAGKTTLAIQLVRELLKSQDGSVPVLLTMNGWDVKEYPYFEDWLADRLEQTYPALPAYGKDMARRLFRDGKIVPVLDGLDEMPAASLPGALAELNKTLPAETQLVLTSRTTEYTAAAQALGLAAVVEAEPMSAVAAADYLDGTFVRTPPHPGWAALLDRLRDDGPTPLSETVSSPLGLWLLRTVYRPAADPSRLLDPARFATAAELRAHLFDRLVPALIEARPPARKDEADLFRPSRVYQPEQVTQWLSYLATLLDRTPVEAEAVPLGGKSIGVRDFAWWRLAALTMRRPPPGPGVMFLVLVASVAWGGVLATLALDTFTWWFLIGGLGIIAMYRERSDNPSWVYDRPGYADLRIRRRIFPLLNKLLSSFSIASGIALGAALLGGVVQAVVDLVTGAALTDSLVEAYVGAVVFGPGMLLVFMTDAVAEWAEIPVMDRQASTPLTSWRADRRLNRVRLLAGGALGAIIGAALIWATDGSAGEMAVATLVAAMVGMTYGLVSGKHHAWPVYELAAFRLARQGRLPRRLMAFLDDAHRLGLLRAVGPLYQFRHAEFHDHLAGRGTPVTAPRQAITPRPSVPRRAGRMVTPVPLRTIETPRKVSGLAFSPDGTRLTWTGGGTTTLADLTGGPERVFRHSGRLIARLLDTGPMAAISPDGRLIAFTRERLGLRDYDAIAGKIWIADLATGAELVELGNEGGVQAMAFSPDSARLAVSDTEAATRIWDVTDGTELLRIAHVGGPHGLAFSPDGTRLATASSSSWGRDRTWEAEIWDSETGIALLRLHASDTELFSWTRDVAFSPDGTLLATAGSDVTRVWDAGSGAALVTLREPARRVAFSPDGTLLAAAGYGSDVRLWDVGDGTEVWEILRVPHGRWSTAAAFSPDGHLFATVAEDKIIQLWELSG